MSGIFVSLVFVQKGNQESTKSKKVLTFKDNWVLNLDVSENESLFYLCTLFHIICY